MVVREGSAALDRPSIVMELPGHGGQCSCAPVARSDGLVVMFQDDPECGWKGVSAPWSATAALERFVVPSERQIDDLCWAAPQRVVGAGHAGVSLLTIDDAGGTAFESFFAVEGLVSPCCIESCAELHPMLVLVGDSNGTLRMLSVADGKEVSVLHQWQPVDDAITCIRWGAHSRYMETGVPEGGAPSHPPRSLDAGESATQWCAVLFTEQGGCHWVDLEHGKVLRSCSCDQTGLYTGCPLGQAWLRTVDVQVTLDLGLRGFADGSLGDPRGELLQRVSAQVAVPTRLGAPLVCGPTASASGLTAFRGMPPPQAAAVALGASLGHDPLPRLEGHLSAMEQVELGGCTDGRALRVGIEMDGSLVLRTKETLSLRGHLLPIVPDRSMVLVTGRGGIALWMVQEQQPPRVIAMLDTDATTVLGVLGPIWRSPDGIVASCVATTDDGRLLVCNFLLTDRMIQPDISEDDGQFPSLVQVSRHARTTVAKRRRSATTELLSPSAMTFVHRAKDDQVLLMVEAPSLSDAEDTLSSTNRSLLQAAQQAPSAKPPLTMDSTMFGGGPLVDSFTLGREPSGEDAAASRPSLDLLSPKWVELSNPFFLEGPAVPASMADTMLSLTESMSLISL
jgi:hypothetical protein